MEVTPDTGADGAFQLLVYVSDVEMTSAGAGLGMDPYDVIIPADHSWETPERTAGRLILTQIDRKHLLGYGHSAYSRRQSLATRTALTTPLDETHSTTPRVRRLPLSDPLLKLPPLSSPVSVRASRGQPISDNVARRALWYLPPRALRTRGGPRPA